MIRNYFKKKLSSAALIAGCILATGAGMWPWPGPQAAFCDDTLLYAASRTQTDKIYVTANRLETDNEASLRERVQRGEYQVYPQAIGWLASGRLALRDGAAWLDGHRLESPVQVEENP